MSGARAGIGDTERVATAIRTPFDPPPDLRFLDGPFSREDVIDERLGTGIDGLDRLLDGGLVRGNSLLIEGPPGSGKSTLGVRIVHEGIARHGEPGLIIAFEEFPRQIYREAVAAGVDLRAHEDTGMLRVLWTPPARVLEGFAGRDDLVERIVREMGVKRLLIDSITQFKRVASSELELREILATLLCRLKLAGVSAFLVKEMDATGDEGIAFEEYLVDASVRLYHDPAASTPGEGSRLIEVRKTRGQGHVAGRHPFELGRAGFCVYPRVRPEDVDALLAPRVAPERCRVGTGSPGLDAMLHGGFWSGTLNLVTGDSGTGKTTLGLQFLGEGLRRGEPALLVSLKETPGAMIERMAPFDTGLLRTLGYDPLACCIERMQAEIVHAVATSPVRRLVFDGLDDLRCTRSDAEVRNHVLVLARIAAAAGVTVVATEQPVAPGAAAAHADQSRLASSVVRLQSTLTPAGLWRRVQVAKLSGSGHETAALDYTMEDQGIEVTERLAADADPTARS